MNSAFVPTASVMMSTSKCAQYTPAVSAARDTGQATRLEVWSLRDRMDAGDLPLWMMTSSTWPVYDPP